MGLQVNFVLKDTSDANIKAMNESLKSLGLDDYGFRSEQDNQIDLDDINNNPESNLKHLKPEGRDLSMKGFKGYFPGWTNVGEMSVDIGSGRTPENEMQKLLAFVFENHLSLKEVSNIQDLIERSGASERFGELQYLDRYFDVSFEYPKDKQELTIDGLGTKLSHWGPDDGTFYTTVYANVDSPRFLKAPVSNIDPSSNPIAKDSNGSDVIGIPLLRFGNDMSKQIGDIYEGLWRLGVRESFDSFVLQHYANTVEVKNLELNSFEEAQRCYEMMKHHLTDFQIKPNGNIDTSSIKSDRLRNNIKQVESEMARLQESAVSGPR